ncbi:MAG TPA: hypothetical protein VMR34_05530 [Candidatus Saccharimonadales bacterium]|nr:hypothetical protein [Candidatus Saccharimonadales bacterium]
MQTELDKEFQKLVLARLQALPADASISIGDVGTIDKIQLLKHVEDGDEIGKKIIEVDIEFLRALKEGDIYDHEQQDSLGDNARL